MCGSVAAFMLMTGLFFVTSGIGSAFAYTPHIRATGTTSSCAACHSVHHSSGPLLLHTRSAAAGVTGSCLVCHDGSDSTASNISSGSADSFSQPSGHSLTTESSGTVRVNGCATCHDVHGASSDVRRIPAKQVNGVAVSSAGKSLCLACHDSSAAWFGPGYPSTSAPTRNAAGYPVAGTWPGSSTYDSASNAHRLIPETTRTVGVSQPVRREQGDCLYCHAAHGGANAYDGLLTTYTVPSQATLASDQADGTYAALCFTCHSAGNPSGLATAPVDIKQFATASGGAGGHSVVTSGGTLPVGSPLPCFECHNPHGSKRANTSLISDERGASLGTTSAAGVRAFCFTCHTTSDTTAGWDSAAATFTPVTPAEKIVGLPRSGGVLHLPANGAHTQAAAAACYQCHGNNYSVGGHNVHDPGNGRFVAAPLALASVPDWSTVPSASVAPSVAIDATVSVTATGSITTNGSVPATGSVPGTSPIETGLPILPGALTIGASVSGAPPTTDTALP